jgi:hypothetical protein
MFNSTKISAAFLAIVLVTGTITLIAPSFMVGAVAQAQQEYGGMDNRYNSYEQEPEYPPQYAEKDNNSYEPSPYEMETYQTPPSSYGNDNYEQPEYTSYKPDYKPEYQSYGKDKLKDSNSVSINKLNCINNNVNINGNNTGDINVGNSGKSATGPGTDEGYVGVGSYDGNGEEGYDNGYNKQKDKGFTCVINNTNINNNFGAGNGTIPIPLTCEECFEEVLDAAQIQGFLDRLTSDPNANLETACNLLLSGENFTEDYIRFVLAMTLNTGIQDERINAIIECLLEVGVEFAPEP